MKLDIKSFLIGILTTVNLFLLYGFTTADSDISIAGRYGLEIGVFGAVWYDTHTGKVIGQVSGQDFGKLFGGNNLLSYEEVLKKIDAIQPEELSMDEIKKLLSE